MASLTDTFWLVSSACVTAKIAFLAFFTLSSIMFFMFPFLLIVIPRYLYVFTYSRLASPSINVLSVAFPADMIIHWVFLVFMVNPHLSQYPFSFSRHVWSPDLLLDMSTRSFAHDMELSCKESIVTGSQVVPKISCRSFWYMFERVGLSVNPCLTPVVDRNGSVMPHCLDAYYCSDMLTSGPCTGHP